MKKLLLLFLGFSIFTGCSIDDDEPKFEYQYAKVISADLPESFKKGKSYTIEVTYLLPTPCHSEAGIEVKRGSSSGDQRRDIYIVGYAMSEINQPECDLEDEDLEREDTFRIFINENETYSFYLWDGYDEDDESKFTVLEIPVE